MHYRYIIFKQFLSCTQIFRDHVLKKIDQRFPSCTCTFLLALLIKTGWKVMNEKSSKCSSAIFCELIRSNDSSDVMEKETQFTNCIEMNSYTFAEFLALLQWHSLKQSWIITAFLGSISISSWVFFFFWFTSL